ncbi:hypothetical protein HDV05_001195, partial [Chytridiales sp. JEL 0842]
MAAATCGSRPASAKNGMSGGVKRVGVVEGLGVGAAGEGEKLGGGEVLEVDGGGVGKGVEAERKRESSRPQSRAGVFGGGGGSSGLSRPVSQHGVSGSGRSSVAVRANIVDENKPGGVLLKEDEEILPLPPTMKPAPETSSRQASRQGSYRSSVASQNGGAVLEKKPFSKGIPASLERNPSNGSLLGLTLRQVERGVSSAAFTMPRSGGWVGWYTTTENEMHHIFFEVNLTINSDGTLLGEPRGESHPFTCKGSISLREPHKISFINREFTGQAMEFNGLFVEDAIAGRWNNPESPSESKGRMCLYRVSDFQTDTPLSFRSGRWTGCYWDEATQMWANVSFGWLEFRGGDIFGMDEMTDDNIFKTTRGSYSKKSGKVKIYVTEWFEMESSVTVYSGKLMREDGHIYGIRLSSTDDDIEEALETVAEDVEDEDSATFRLWRVDGEDKIEWLQSEAHDSPIP